MKAANLVSRQSEMYNKNKEQGIYVKEEVVIVDAPSTNKPDQLKKVQAKGEDYRNMDEHRVDLNSLAKR